MNFSINSSSNESTASSLFFFPVVKTACCNLSYPLVSIKFLTRGKTSSFSNSIFSFPYNLENSSWNSQIFLIFSCANIIAFSIVSSSNSFAPASTMFTASFVPATIKSSSLSSNSFGEGFKINSPFLYPTITLATGPKNGISEIISARDDPITPK